MVKIDLYNMSGKKAAQTQASEKIFGVNVNPNLIYQIINAQHANSRISIAHTKNRGEVSGSNIKPWRQKGTGRARAGSVRSPLWAGGGVTFGPRSNRNYHQKTNRKTKKLALAMALSERVKEKRILIIDKLNFMHAKTKDAYAFINNLPIQSGSILIILAKNDINARLSLRNLEYVKILLADSLNVIDLVSHDWILIDKDALEIIDKTYSDKVVKIITAKKTNLTKTKKTKKPKTVG